MDERSHKVRNQVVGIAVLAICALAGYGSWDSNTGPVAGIEATVSSSATAQVTPPTENRIVASHNVVNPAAMTAQPAFQVSLPDVPIGTKVVDVLAKLKYVADQGNTSAACKVGVELQRCASVFRIQKARADQPAPEIIASQYKSQPDRDQFLASIERADEALDRDAAFCKGVTREQAQDAGQYLWQAASAGSVAAMSKYAKDPPIDYERPAEYADEIIRYRDNASRFLWGAVQGGDAMALYVSWFGATSGLSMIGRGVFKRDPYTAMVYAAAVRPMLDSDRQRQVDGNYDSLRQELGPERMTQAEAEGAALRQQYFATATTPANGGDDGAVDSADCFPRDYR